MTSRGRRPAFILSFLLALVGLAVLGSPSAAAASHRTLSYAALGDSYAAGQGAGAYRNDCLQSAYGYPARLDAAKRVHLRDNHTCTGATSIDVATQQVVGLKKNTRLVTVTAGGNDLGVAAVAAACVPGPGPACSAAIADAQALLAVGPDGTSVLGQRLGAMYGAIATATPRALIVVTGYPLLFEPLPADDPNAPVVAAVNSATQALNATIQAAVAAGRATGIKITYVDVTAPFAGHGIGSSMPYFVVAGPDAFHPNRAGYRAYAGAVKRVLGIC